MSQTRTPVTPQDVPVAAARQLRDDASRARTLRLGDSEVELTERSREVLMELFDRLAHGESVLLVPAEEMLSTQQAADLLRVSRPTLVKMLEDGILPFERPGTHRRVPRQAVQDFLDERVRRRAGALQEFAATRDPADTDEPVTTR